MNLDFFLLAVPDYFDPKDEDPCVIDFEDYEHLCFLGQEFDVVIIDDKVLLEGEQLLDPVSSFPELGLHVKTIGQLEREQNLSLV